MNDTTTFATATGPDKHLINTYVSDMTALMQHVAAPLDAQLEETGKANFADAHALVAAIKQVATSHVVTLDAHLERLGGSADHPIKSAWVSILGVGAGALDSVRSSKISKGLRDDYTALNLAAISYTMLHATAVGVGDSATASIAKQGLDEVAPLIVKISQVMPKLVLEELQADGEAVQIDAAEFSKETTQQSWA